MKKRLLTAALCLVTVFALCGCGSDEPEYPVMDDPSEPDNMKEASFNGFTGSYDADKWVFDSSLGLFAIYDKLVYDAGNPDGQCPNVNIVVSEAYEGPLTSEDMDSLMEEMKNMGVTGLSVENNEMRTFNGQPVIYYETKVSLTDDDIDFMIENGNITEADLEAAGGRDALKAAGESTQVAMAAIIDGKIVIATGTYYDNPDQVLEALKLLLKTGKVS